MQQARKLAIAGAAASPPSLDNILPGVETILPDEDPAIIQAQHENRAKYLQDIRNYRNKNTHGWYETDDGGEAVDKTISEKPEKGLNTPDCNGSPFMAKPCVIFRRNLVDHIRTPTTNQEEPLDPDGLDYVDTNTDDESEAKRDRKDTPNDSEINADQSDAPAEESSLEEDTDSGGDVETVM
jgi:hypothetical protein